MSMERVEAATLGTYGPPYFPPAMYDLARAFVAKSPTGMSDAQSMKAAQACPGFENFWPCEVTDDGYQTRWVAEFAVGRGSIAVAMPTTNDIYNRHGVRLDRSPALYIAPGTGVALEKAVEIVRQFVVELKQM